MTPWLSRPAAQHAMRLALALLACLLAAWVEWQRPVLPTRLDEALRDRLLRAAGQGSVPTD